MSDTFFSNLATVKEGVQSLKVQGAALERAALRVQVIVAALLVSSDTELEANGFKSATENDIRKRLYQVTGIDSRSSAGRSLRNNIGYGFKLVGDLDRRGFAELNSFGSICENILAQVPRIEASKVDAANQKRAADKADKAAQAEQAAKDALNVKALSDTAARIAAENDTTITMENMDAEGVIALIINASRMLDLEGLNVALAGIVAVKREMMLASEQAAQEQQAA